MLELKRVLARAHRLLGRKVDLVGMDACLMTMLEVAYQIRDHALVLVGSEELEPGTGWPYAGILGGLASKPTLGAEELGATIVRHYVEAYRTPAWMPPSPPSTSTSSTTWWTRWTPSR